MSHSVRDSRPYCELLRLAQQKPASKEVSWIGKIASEVFWIEKTTSDGMVKVAEGLDSIWGYWMAVLDGLMVCVSTVKVAILL